MIFTTNDLHPMQRQTRGFEADDFSGAITALEAPRCNGGCAVGYQETVVI